MEYSAVDNAVLLRKNVYWEVKTLCSLEINASSPNLLQLRSSILNDSDVGCDIS
jgi:hypothetical protein